MTTSQATSGLLSGLLPEVDAAVRDALGSDARPPDPERPLTLGLPEGAKAPAIAALARIVAGPVLVVTARPNHALALLEDVRVWLPADDPRPVLPFPERESLPYERRAPDRDAVQARLRALASLAAGERPLIIADAQALSQRTCAIEQRRAGGGTALPPLRVGGRLALEPFLTALDAAGYRVQAVVDEPGTVARRGGIIDLFPVTDETPLRIELVGDEIESLRRFDPATQRSTAQVQAATLTTATEAQVDADAVTLAASLDVDRLHPEAAVTFGADLTQIERGALPGKLGFWTAFLTRGALWDHLPAGTLVVWDEGDEILLLLDDLAEQAAAVRRDLETRSEIPPGLPLPQMSTDETIAGLDGRSRIDLRQFASEDLASEVRRLPFSAVESYGGRLRPLMDYLQEVQQGEERAVLVSLQAPRLASLFVEYGLTVRTEVPAATAPPADAVTLLHGAAPQGWRLRRPQGDVLLLTDTEVFGFAKQRRAQPRAARKHTAFLDGLKSGDYVVHIEHGIGRYAGMTQEQIGDRTREYLQLTYADNDRLLVPTDQLHRLQRYVGPSDSPPALTRLGTQQWQRAKQRVRDSVRELAQDLLSLYAARQVLPGVAAPPDGPWQMELEAAFPYIETPDQVQAVGEVKADMELPRPMDRLVVGDVGYGKTEIAVRAAFKSALGGQQVAMLVPTTVLAQQHFDTFRARLAPFPVRIEMLSRFRSEAEQRRIVKDLAAGRVDIVIGTHRLLQQDVQFKSLGLVIIDEEQRFGVAHKERLKQMRREVDVLTLSATPIPRTLHMAVAGIRDMSTLETPPAARVPITTYVMDTEDQTTREAILHEVERGGQVYAVHNRVQSIEQVARRLRDLVPEARFLVGHGQMPEEKLAQVMADFTAGDADVLVCTTIIESGLDIPNVNTIIIFQAQRLGLAQLYQLRGRVGRGAVRAYAYLFYDRSLPLTETARKRLQTIFEATELGAGFQIALRDLEIRGAGSLLGAEQSGYIGAVGFELYTQMLGEAVERLRAETEGRRPEPPRRGPAVALDLPIVAHIPESYVGDANLRLSIYQNLADVDRTETVDEIAAGLLDRFGPPPSPVQNLLSAVRLRTLAARIGAESLAREEGAIVLRLADGMTFEGRAHQAGLPPSVHVGRTLARFDLDALGDGWMESLADLLTQLGDASPAGVAAR